MDKVETLDTLQITPRLAKSTSWFLWTGILGILLCGFSYYQNSQSFFVSYLTAFSFFLAIALGALFFVMVQHLSRAGWSTTVRRTAENLSKNLVVMGILFLPLLLGISDIFHWSHADVRATDHLIRAKSAYLNLPFFLIRTAIYFIVWAVLGWWFLKTSRLQDETKDPLLSIKMSNRSTIGLILFGLTSTFYAIDWIMSIDAHWFSTMFGVYFFAGAVVAFYCTLILVLTWLKSTGHIQKSVSTEHYHDMGKLLFGHNIFWTYIGFSQFMLIWYANIPEETLFFLHRSEGAWKTISLMLPWCHFAVPFLFLMSHNVKRKPWLLSIGAAWLLIMCYIDIYWLIQPYFYHHGPHFGLSDIGAILTVGSFFLFFLVHTMSQASLIPIGDPRLKASLSYDNGIPKK
jgi:hypothetical protein